jgi:protein-tyrosine phosphatase
VDSAGTCSFHCGESPDRRAQRACKDKGVDIGRHRARQITQADWTKFTVIAALDRSILSALEEQRPEDATAELVLFNAPGGVGDPYYGEAEGFARMFETISATMDAFLREHRLI